MVLQDIKEEDVKNLNNLLERLKLLSERGVTPSLKEQLLSILNQLFPVFPYMVLIQEFPEISRITINKKVVGSNKRIMNIKDLKYPPSERVKNYGRCNLPGQSVLYATNASVLVAMSEMKPDIGDLITETTWKVKASQPLTYCPIFKNQPPNNGVINPRMLEISRLHKQKLKEYPPNQSILIESLVQFVADAFTKLIHQNNNLDYIFSAYFSDKILNKFDGGTIDAIYYPSVKQNLSFENLAIKAKVFDNKYELFRVRDSVVIAKPQGYLLEGLGAYPDFDLMTGKIFWEPPRNNQEKKRIRQLKDQFGVDLNEGKLKRIMRIFS